MTEYRFNGTDRHTYHQVRHPERDGILQADPDEIIEFGDADPPNDGQWHVQDADGDWVAWYPEPEPDEDQEPGTAATGDTEPNPEE